MRGYWENAEATAKPIDDDGWMHTGDLAVMDDDGYVNIVGRIKDMVIRGGENLYPREIEEVLFYHPAVAAAQVIGVPDERMGEELMAWVVLREGATTPRTSCGRSAASGSPTSRCRATEVRRRVPDDRHRQVQKFKMREMAIEDSASEGRRDQDGLRPVGARLRSDPWTGPTGSACGTHRSSSRSRNSSST